MSVAMEGGRGQTRAAELVDGVADHTGERRALRTGRASGSALLRWSLRGADVAALCIAWSVIDLLWSSSSADLVTRLFLGMVPYAAFGCWLIARHDLYRARVATMRTVEQAGLMRACVVLVAASAVVQQLRDESVSLVHAVAAGAVTFVCLATARTTYRVWLKTARSAGRFIRPVLLVGVDDQTAEIFKVMTDNPGLGFAPVGVLGAKEDAERANLADSWLGDLDRLSPLVRDLAVTGAIVSSTAIAPPTLNLVTRSLLAQRCHVHLSTGITGVDQRRLRPMHLGYEPLLYLEPLELTRTQVVAKRALDVVVSVVVAVLLAPVVAAAALAIKLDDRGPVLFRQSRVGRDGGTFTIFKLRTMAVDAEDRLDELMPYNERSGPLFKMEEDPRITRAGRILRKLSIDELPQLLNVLRGDMSLVGPRPALPSEALGFGERLQRRTKVAPGVTGLWQVEARSSASMHIYERLDLFYVENWSVGLDIMVIIATLEEELVKFIRFLWPNGTTQPAPPVSPLPDRFAGRRRRARRES